MKDPRVDQPLDMVPSLTITTKGLPVGRLDMDTTGLFCSLLPMARWLKSSCILKHVWKHYVAHVVGTPTEEQTKIACVR